MRIGIIGGGAAGLVCAWLLEQQHEVTLFEKDNRLGGHAHTVDIEAYGRQFSVDAGFEFLSAGAAYSTFNRLLDALKVRRTDYDATLTVYHSLKSNQNPVVMPPFRDGRVLWSSLTPGRLCTLILFRQFLTRAKAFIQRHDTSLTIDDYIAQQNLPVKFVREFLYPFLLAGWCVDLEEFRRYAAYNVLYYIGVSYPRGMRPPVQSEITGGTRVYIDALAGSLVSTTIELSSQPVRVTREKNVYEIEDAQRHAQPFDHLIIATNARQARHLLATVEEAAPVRQQLEQFGYVQTAIAIHGDRRLMPQNQAVWSSVNVRWDGRHSAISVWKSARETPIFKSWVTFDQSQPEPLFALVNFEHVMVTPAYFTAQGKIKGLQGQNNLWLAGAYTYDVDSHESAVRSAVTIAQILAPESSRLKTLQSN